MSIFKYSAAQLFDWLISKEDMLVLDVRNATDFARFKVEAPYPVAMENISYYDFMEIAEECVARLPAKKPIRVVCAKEGSAQYVAEILEQHGFADVGYLAGGIKSWGNLLVPVLLNPGEPYALYQFIRPGKASCSYALLHGGEMMTFDPSRNASFYLDFAKDHHCRLTKTFETHLQADYIAGSRMLMEATGATFMANSNDFAGACFPYTGLKDGEIIRFGDGGGPAVEVMFTPGHTPGSTSYLIDNRFLIAGDTVFLQSVGRPDLGGKVAEWSDILFATLGKIKQLEPQILLLPGHYISWQEANGALAFVAPLAQAIAHNKDIYAIDNRTDFLAFITSNMRTQPVEYATIRKLNANIEQVDDEKAEELDLGKNECAASAYAARQQAEKV